MIAFWIAVIVGAVVSTVYTTLAVQAFARVRRDILTGQRADQAADLAPDAPDAEAHGVFTWKAGLAVVTSTSVIVLLGTNAVFWYLPAILAIGTAVAVIAAFVADRTTGHDTRQDRKVQA